MPAILCNSYFNLFHPVRHTPDADGADAYHAYVSDVTIEGSRLAFSVAQPIDKQHPEPLPHGAVAEVFGTLSIVGQSLLVTASTTTGLYVATNPTTRRTLHELFEPNLFFSGRVSAVGRLDVGKPGVKSVDVTIESGDVWPQQLTVIRCFLNRDDRRFRYVGDLAVGMALDVSGVVMGWVDGKLGVDVHDVRASCDDALPGRPFTTMPTPFASCKINSTHHVIFGDASALPPVGQFTQPVGNVSARWLPASAGPQKAAASVGRRARQGRLPQPPALAETHALPPPPYTAATCRAAARGKEGHVVSEGIPA